MRAGRFHSRRCPCTAALFIGGDTTRETLFRHRPDAGLELLAEIPATLPGARQRQSYSSNAELPGLLDLAELAGGDVLVLLNESVTPPLGLRLARWVAATGQWVVSPVVIKPGTVARRGEVCLGPVASSDVCPDFALAGCAPFSCAVPVTDVIERPTARLGEAMLVVQVGFARVIYEATETSVLPAAGSITDVQSVRLAIPEWALPFPAGARGASSPRPSAPDGSLRPP
jgi:hypothetical protein